MDSDSKLLFCLWKFLMIQYLWYLYLDPYGNQFLSIAFSKEQFSGWLENLVPVTIILGAVSLGYHIVSSLFRYKQSSSPINHVAL